MRYRNLSRQYQKTGFLSLPGDKHRGNLGDIWPVLVLGIKAAGIIWGLDYGTGEADWWCKSKQHKRKHREAKSREASVGGGWSCSSEEVTVMVMERRASHNRFKMENNWKFRMIFDLKPKPKGVMKSRMTGDCQVRFCERLGVKLPRSTRLTPILTKTNQERLILV